MQSISPHPLHLSHNMSSPYINDKYIQLIAMCYILPDIYTYIIYEIF